MEKRQIVTHIDEVTQSYRGNVNALEQAIGAWLVGRQMGWKVLYLMQVLTSYIFRTTESCHSVSGSYFGPSSKRTFPDFSIVPS